jgi:hypothetical protein
MDCGSAHTGGYNIEKLLIYIYDLCGIRTHDPSVPSIRDRWNTGRDKRIFVIQKSASKVMILSKYKYYGIPISQVQSGSHAAFALTPCPV